LFTIQAPLPPASRYTRLERRVVERAVGDVARAAGGAFDDVDVGQAQRGELPHHVLEQRLRFGSWMSLAGVTGDRRMPVTPPPMASTTARITSSSRRARFSIEPP
jgi:hypothetical protein